MGSHNALRRLFNVLGWGAIASVAAQGAWAETPQQQVAPTNYSALFDADESAIDLKTPVYPPLSEDSQSSGPGYIGIDAELDPPSLDAPPPAAGEPMEDAEEITGEPAVVDEYAGHIEMGHPIEFPHDHAPPFYEFIEAFPTWLSKPDEPLGRFFEKIICAKHDHIHVELEEHPIGIQPTPERPPLIIEWNEKFLGRGFLEQGVETRTGQITRPAFWVFGQFRTGINYFDNGVGEPVAEWANRLDLFGQVNFTGTERLLVGVRPLDEELATRREFSSYDFRNGQGIDGWNSDIQTLFFEGDFGEIFPWLDPYDVRGLDYGFSVGRMPLLAQQGLLINEDMLDAVTVTKNTLYGNGNLNLRMTGVWSWDNVTRNSAVGQPNTEDAQSHMFALLTESDFARSMVNLDAVYVDSGDPTFGDLWAFGASAVQRHYLYENTYNTSLHFLASVPGNSGPTAFADSGQLLFAQTSWTPHHTEDLVYVNGFYALDQFTSPTRGPLMGGPLGQTGLTFAAAGLGRYGAPIAVATNDVVGAAIGYQLFFDHTRQQVIVEFGGRKETQGPVNRGAIAATTRYQKAIGQHWIWVVDGFVNKQEGRHVGVGARSELLIKF